MAFLRVLHGIVGTLVKCSLWYLESGGLNAQTSILLNATELAVGLFGDHSGHGCPQTLLIFARDERQHEQR